MLRRAVVTLVLFVTPLAAQLPKGTLWTDPGNVAALDFGGSVGVPASPPKPPFRFLREDPSGTQLKIYVKDANGALWNVKFGYEVRAESFCWRIARACGYFAEPSFLVPSGQFAGFSRTQRTDPTLKPDGTFKDGRFQYRNPKLRFLAKENWYWDRPPFGGTKELSGLKILIMLLSNYDNKDARVGKGGPNTAIFALRTPKGIQYHYAFTDWGSGMGRLGPEAKRANWNCEAFTEQSNGFVQKVEKNQVIFGYDGNVNDGFRTGIPPAHVEWLMQYLGKITDAQLLAGLKASGSWDGEAECFVKALRSRIEQLRAVK